MMACKILSSLRRWSSSEKSSNHCWRAWPCFSLRSRTNGSSRPNCCPWILWRPFRFSKRYCPPLLERHSSLSFERICTTNCSPNSRATDVWRNNYLRLGHHHSEWKSLKYLAVGRTPRCGWCHLSGELSRRGHLAKHVVCRISSRRTRFVSRRRWWLAEK